MHNNLIKKGRTWLKRQGCILILTELVGGAAESPDVFGFKSTGATILIECKASRSDFLSDAKKWFRLRPHNGLGRERYYLAPKGLLATDEMPNGWGLLELTGRGISCAKESDVHDHNSLAEKAVLVSTIRRLNLEPGEHTSLTVISPYTHQTKCRATLSVEAEDSHMNINR